MAQELLDKIRAAAQAKNVDPDVAVRIAQNESSLDPMARAKTSTAGGLFGVVDPTWKQFKGQPGKKFNPDENIRVGTDVIASNTEFLRKNLGREPSASEIYTAHFFGPTGASAFLAATPNTPVADVLGAKVVKANPQLQGKTVGEVKQMLQGKMGETTPAPTTTTKTAPAPTDSQQMMEGALRSGMSAKAEDLGSGYKAALALSFLGAEDADKPESDSDLQARLDKEEEDTAAAELAAYKPYNALKDLQLTATAHLPKQEPVHLAAGGLPFTPSVGIKGSAREELDAIKSQYDKYNADADAYNAALNKYKTEQYEPYMAAVQKYNDAATLWNQGPRTTDFGMTAPTAPKEFSLTAPTAPTTSAEAYAAMQEAAKTDATRRQAAIDAASDPERYGLTINKFFADGGDVAGPGLIGENLPFNPNPMAGTGAMMMSHGGPVHRADGSPQGGEVPTPLLFSVPTYAETVSHEMYPGEGGQFDRKDAARHMLAAGTLQRKYGDTAAEMLGNLHEIKTSPFRWLGSKLGISEMPVDYEQDLHNNRVGIELARRSKSQKDLEDLVNAEAERAKTQQTSGAAWIGKPVKRADGSPETGELGPFLGNPNIQRQGAKARALAQQRDVNTLPDPRTYAAVSGFLGTPPDEQGFSVLHPDIQGIKKAGEAGFYTGIGAQIAPVAAPVMKGLGKMAGSALNERMLSGQSLTPGFNTPAPIMFAVREPGGPLLQVPQRSSHTWVDNKTGKALEQVDPLIPIMHDLAGTPDQPLNEWFRNKVGSYIRRDMGTEKDQFVKAADEGRRLHFVDKPPSTMTMSQAARETPHSVRYVRESEGFPAEGFAQTPYGRLVEAKTDWSIWPMEAGTLLGDSDEKLLLPIVRDMAKQNPQMRVHEINPQIEEHLGLTSLRDKMFKMRQMSPDFAAYNQPAVKIPERYMFTDKTLQGLTPAQASERVAQFDAWKQETKQKMASQAVLKDPAVDRAPAANGHVWVNAPDLEDNPALRQLIQDVGCDGGWCTKNDYQAVNNGSGPNRLSVLMDSKARPKVQMTITTKSPTTDDFLVSMADDEVNAFKANNPDVALYDDNSIKATPEYQQWARMNPESVSITELKGVNNQTDMKGAPFLKQVQDRIKQLDAQIGLQHVENLDGIGMKDISSMLWTSYPVQNRPPIGLDGIRALENEVRKLNNGSRFIENDPKMIEELIEKGYNNLFGPEGHATGGMIERNMSDNRRYL